MKKNNDYDDDDGGSENVACESNYFCSMVSSIMGASCWRK